ncbi:10886_t:CDS:2 [Cetraspora pellucida]|uniref:10886_t:CDS:1 n=1 Tax=Cetraspora pellucida TaxID=1433469 RepID=A0A9N9N6I5_9GLOM|nr:10886_t:CDS:2 [Cetraspora pellucida]
MTKFVLLLLTTLALLFSNVKCQLENNQIDDLSTRDPWLFDNHISSPFDEFMTSKQDIHSNPFQAIDELVDMSIEATEAMLDSLNFNNLDEDSSVTTIEITIVESPDLPSNEVEFPEIDDTSKITLDDEYIQDQQYDPLMDFSFLAVAAFVAVIPVILSMIRGKKEKKYEYLVVHTTDECQTADLESATCVKK